MPNADEYYLEICGANSSADIYINGEHLAHHDGGYSIWRIDITKVLKPRDFIVIVVNNSASDNIYP